MADQYPKEFQELLRLHAEAHALLDKLYQKTMQPPAEKPPSKKPPRKTYRKSLNGSTVEQAREAKIIKIPSLLQSTMCWSLSKTIRKK